MHEFEQVTDCNRNRIQQFIIMIKSIGVRAFGDDKMCRVLMFYNFYFLQSILFLIYMSKYE